MSFTRWLITFSLFFMASVTWADSCGANGMRSSMSEMRDFGCKLEKMSADCQGFFYKNPQLLKFSKDCSNPNEKRALTLQQMDACEDAGIESWTGIWKDLNKAGKAIDACDANINCKKNIALEAYFACPDKNGVQQFPCTDVDELSQVDIHDLLRKRDNVRELAKRDPAYRALILSHGAVLPNEDGGVPIEDLVSATFKNLGVQAQCFNSVGYFHMACYALATVADPTLLVGGTALGALKGAEWTAAVFRGLNAEVELDKGTAALLRYSAKKTAQTTADAAAGTSGVGAQIRAANKEVLETRIWDFYAVPAPKSVEAGKALNIQKIAKLNNFVPQASVGRKAAVSEADANALFKQVQEHPVVGTCSVGKYDPEGNIGFCFGRSAAYVMEGLKSGISKDSIKKVFAVGKFRDPTHDWDYHVATVIKGTDGKWWALDPTKFDKPVHLEDWYSSMGEMSKEKPFNIFLTTPDRVLPSTPVPTYSHPDIKGINDYYKDYFKSLRDSSDPP